MAVAKSGGAYWERTGVVIGTEQTWLGWVRPDLFAPNNDYRTVLAQDGGEVNWLGVYQDTSGGIATVELWVNSFDGPIVEGPALALDEYLFLAVVRSGDGSSWKLAWRWEGDPSLNTATGTEPDGPTTIGQILKIGAEHGGHAPLAGGYAHWRVFPAALTDQQILAESASPVALQPAWADWPLEDVDSDEDDISGNNRPLTLLGLDVGAHTNTTGPDITIPGGGEDVIGSFSMDGGGSLELTGTREKIGTLLLPGGGTFEVFAAKEKEVSAELDASGELDLTATKEKEVSGLLDAGGEMTFTGTVGVVASFTVDGGGSLTLDGTKEKESSGVLDAGGELELDAVKEKQGSGLLDGGGELTLEASTSTDIIASFTLDGGGSAVLGSVKEKEASGLLDGGGEFELTGSGARPRVDITVRIGASRKRDLFAVLPSRKRPVVGVQGGRVRPPVAVGAGHQGSWSVGGSRTRWRIGPSRTDRT